MRRRGHKGWNLLSAVHERKSRTRFALRMNQISSYRLRAQACVGNKRERRKTKKKRCETSRPSKAQVVLLFAPVRDLVVVLPTLPVMPTTGPSNLSLTFAARSWSADRVSSTITYPRLHPSGAGRDDIAPAHPALHVQTRFFHFSAFSEETNLKKKNKHLHFVTFRGRNLISPCRILEKRVSIEIVAAEC